MGVPDDYNPCVVPCKYGDLLLVASHQCRAQRKQFNVVCEEIISIRFENNGEMG